MLASLYLQLKSKALLCIEIGGFNAIEPLLLGAQLDLAVLDADTMGRAFPELQMSTMFIHGHWASPAVLVDERV